ncbi:MAG: hypothetical protein DMF81_24360 [Acidobacteria bacterium]|nr:MAG: hypothetical protein DMF81_24360 [Acidobacteriota bacterium]
MAVESDPASGGIRPLRSRVRERAGGITTLNWPELSTRIPVTSLTRSPWLSVSQPAGAASPSFRPSVSPR